MKNGKSKNKKILECITLVVKCLFSQPRSRIQDQEIRYFHFQGEPLTAYCPAVDSVIYNGRTSGGRQTTEKTLGANDLRSSPL